MSGLKRYKHLGRTRRQLCLVHMDWDRDVWCAHRNGCDGSSNAQYALGFYACIRYADVYPSNEARANTDTIQYFVTTFSSR
jgi:hypothetical protein